MNLLIVAPFCSLPSEPYFNRFLYLANLLARRHNVTLVTSRFRHFDKSMRAEMVDNQENLSIVLIDEPGYTKNVSIRRIQSHSVFLKNFKHWFDESNAGKLYDVVYSAFPLIGTNIFLGKKKKALDFKLIIDIQDIWPEAISSAIPLLSSIPPRWIPFSWRADEAYRAADGLVGVSKSYLDRAISVNPNAASKVVYIGADSEKINSISARQLKAPSFNFCYIGTLSHSYDMETVVRGINALREKHHDTYLHVLGGGPELENLRSIAGEGVIFYGFVPYEEMIAIAKGCDALINPIKSNAKQSITNKLSDYIFLSKPILNSQTNLEVLEILKKMGDFNYSSGNVASFSAAAKRVMLGDISVRHFDGLIDFDRSQSYEGLVDFIESLEGN